MLETIGSYLVYLFAFCSGLCWRCSPPANAPGL